MQDKDRAYNVSLFQDADACNDCSPKNKLKVSFLTTQEEKQPSTDLQGIINQLRISRVPDDVRQLIHPWWI